MLWLLLLVLSAFGQSVQGVPDGAVVVEVSPDATVQVLPRTQPRTVEIVVLSNDKPLDVQLEHQRTAHVSESWSATAGSGTWFITLYVSGPEIDVRAQREADGRVAFVTRELSGPVRRVEVAPPSVEALLADRVVRRPARPARMPLNHLSGDAWIPKLDPRVVRLPVEAWRPLGDVGDETDPRTIDGIRKRLVTTEDPARRTALLQHLGLAHQAMGLHREARFYFDEVARQRTDWPAAAVNLHRADAALATGRWDDARQRCRDARAGGADDVATLTCLGGLSLATGHPAPTPTARALLAVADKPEAKLVASQLLVIDGRTGEARPVVASLDGLPEAWMAWRDATLGDVLYAEGDLEGARSAWRDVGTSGELGRLGAQRARLFRLAGQAPSSWAGELPSLDRDAALPRSPGAEAHYLAAQIASTYDEADEAARHLTALVDRRPEITRVSDVGSRLLQVCDRRLKQLHRAERPIDEAAFYLDCWRPELDRMAIDVQAVQGVSEAFEELGLMDRALRVQRDVTASLARENREEPGALARLAHLYNEAGRHEEALETIAYTRRIRTARAVDGTLSLVEAQALNELGRPERAQAAWRRAEGDETTRADAQVQRALALAQGERCTDALPVLERFADGDADLQQGTVTQQEARLAVSRCLLDSGDPARATAVAVVVASQDPTTGWAAQASWIASVAAARQEGAPVPEAPVAADPLWAATIEELRATETALARAAALR